MSDVRKRETGVEYYGERFVAFSMLEDIRDLVKDFRDFYYKEKISEPNSSMQEILCKFNREDVYPRGRAFHPSIYTASVWGKRWDKDIKARFGSQNPELKKGELSTERKTTQLIKTRNENNELLLGAPGDNDLESGVRTLGGELLNDALQMLKEDQNMEDMYNGEILIRRRTYIVNVLSHVTRLVHGKAALMLKAQEEKRNTAGFLMSLLAKATAGKMSEEEMNLLKSAYTPKQNEQSV